MTVSKYSYFIEQGSLDFESCTSSSNVHTDTISSFKINDHNFRVQKKGYMNGNRNCLKAGETAERLIPQYNPSKGRTHVDML